MIVVLFLMSLCTGCGPGSLFVSGNGATNGTNGLNGSNGHSAAFSELAADSTVCPTGGTVLSAGVDLNDNQVLEVSETKQVVITCNGQTGATGATGATGSQGSAGTNGVDATPVTLVQLCPGVSNYGTFIELGVCLNNTTLIAVYSQNGGFATVLAPGNYSSNAIGSACSLTVGPNCKVTH